MTADEMEPGKWYKMADGRVGKFDHFAGSFAVLEMPATEDSPKGSAKPTKAFLRTTECEETAEPKPLKKASIKDKEAPEPEHEKHEPARSTHPKPPHAK